MPHNESELMDLYKLLESTNSLWEMHGLPGFFKVLVKDLWLKYDTEKLRWAIGELGSHNWKPRMLEKILDGSANVNYTPDHAKPRAPYIQPVHRRSEEEIVRDIREKASADDVDPAILAQVDESIRALVNKFRRK